MHKAYLQHFWSKVPLLYITGQYQCQLDQPFTFDGCMADINPRSTLHPDEMMCLFIQLDKWMFKVQFLAACKTICKLQLIHLKLHGHIPQIQFEVKQMPQQ